MRCFGVWPNPEISFTNAIVSSLFSVVTIPGNLLVVIVIFKNPNGKMRTPFNWFIFNLAVADLLVGMIVEPLSMVVHIREGLGLAIKYDVYLKPIYFTSCTASVFSLGMLTVDRYIAIATPMEYRAKLSNSRAVYSSLGIWFVSIALPFLQREIGFLWYFFVFGNASVLVTFFVLLFTYLRVHFKLRLQIKQLEGCRYTNDKNQAANNSLHMEARITKTLMLMLLAFMFCYTPSLVMIYLMNLCTICSCQWIHWFRDLSYIFIVLNSSVNPFLYAWRLPNFREAIKTLVTRSNRRPSTATVIATSLSNLEKCRAPPVSKENHCRKISSNQHNERNVSENTRKDSKNNNSHVSDIEGAAINEVAIQLEENL